MTRHAGSRGDCGRDLARLDFFVTFFVKKKSKGRKLAKSHCPGIGKDSKVCKVGFYAEAMQQNNPYFRLYKLYP